MISCGESDLPFSATHTSSETLSEIFFCQLLLKAGWIWGFFVVPVFILVVVVVDGRSFPQVAPRRAAVVFLMLWYPDLKMTFIHLCQMQIQP